MQVLDRMGRVLRNQIPLPQIYAARESNAAIDDADFSMVAQVHGHQPPVRPGGKEKPVGTRASRRAFRIEGTE